MTDTNTLNELLAIINQVPNKREKAHREACDRFKNLKDDMQMAFKLLLECKKCKIDTTEFGYRAYKNKGGVTTGFEVYTHTKVQTQFIYEDESDYLSYDGNIIKYGFPTYTKEYESIDKLPVSAAPAINSFCDRFIKYNKDFLIFIKKLATKDFSN